MSVEYVLTTYCDADIDTTGYIDIDTAIEVCKANEWEIIPINDPNESEMYAFAVVENDIVIGNIFGPMGGKYPR